MITNEQRIARRGYIGSSDAAAILGLDPWRNAADVYWQKVGEADVPPNPAMEAGNKLESVVLDYAEKELGRELLRDVFNASDIFCANHDAIVARHPEGVEAKTSGITGPGFNDQWGEAGTDQIPEHVVVQCQHQMFVANLQLVWVPVLIGGRGFQIYKVDRNDELIGAMQDRLRQFWVDHVVAKVPPEGILASLDVIRRVKRVPDKVAQVPVNVMDRWLNCKQAAKESLDEKERAEALLLTYLGDAEAGDSLAGRVTYYAQKRAAYEVKESSYRVLRHIKPKRS